MTYMSTAVSLFICLSKPLELLLAPTFKVHRLPSSRHMSHHAGRRATDSLIMVVFYWGVVVKRSGAYETTMKL